MRSLRAKATIIFLREVRAFVSSGLVLHQNHRSQIAAASPVL
jgi:hypothetical protein